MRTWAIAGFLIAVSGCSSLKTTSPSTGTGSAPATAPPVAAPPPVATPPAAPPPAAPTPAVAAPPAASAPVAPAPAVPASATPFAAAAGTAARSSHGEPKSPVAAHPITPPAQPSAHAPPPATRTPTLNLADLEQRLRDTRAIGVFTKLSLKNQVDDLLKAFRTLYRDPNKRPSAELRQRYDGLLLKVLSLLQDGDPPLAAAIASSREAIWSILADPEQFAKMDI
jgi:hypothetical protein